MAPPLLLSLIVLLLALTAPATAAPPANDAPTAPQAFAPFTASNGRPDEQQAIAELFEATADPGIAPCLGRSSFARTVWFRVPEAQTAQRLSVEAMGRTLDVLDVAAFVQPEVAPPPPPPPPAEPTPTPTPTPRARASQTSRVAGPGANVCSGVGAGGAEESEEPTSGITLHVPARHPVLIQVGRRGTPRSPDDDRGVLSLELRALDLPTRPAGDAAGTDTPAARVGRDTYLDLFGATISGEDPAQPACPSLGTVWRKFTPGRSGKRLIRTFGPGVETLTVFAGRRPTADNALDCVNRETAGALEMVVPVRKRRPMWIRLGADSTAATDATLQVLEGRGATVIDGGPGGADPTAGGPGGGFPAACFTARPERARVKGPRLRGAAGAYNRFTRVPLRLVASGASVCDAELTLRGPRNGVYAKSRVRRIKGRATVRLPRLRSFRRGRYRLRVTAVNAYGRRVNVRSSLGGRLG